jgi:hypothetical protein
MESWLRSDLAEDSQVFRVAQFLELFDGPTVSKPKKQENTRPGKSSKWIEELRANSNKWLDGLNEEHFDEIEAAYRSDEIGYFRSPRCTIEGALLSEYQESIFAASSYLCNFGGPKLPHPHPNTPDDWRQLGKKTYIWFSRISKTRQEIIKKDFRSYMTNRAIYYVTPRYTMRRSSI